MRVFQINILLLALCNSFFKGRGPGIYSGAFFYTSAIFCKPNQPLRQIKKNQDVLFAKWQQVIQRTIINLIESGSNQMLLNECISVYINELNRMPSFTKQRFKVYLI